MSAGPQSLGVVTTTGANVTIARDQVEQLLGMLKVRAEEIESMASKISQATHLDGSGDLRLRTEAEEEVLRAALSDMKGAGELARGLGELERAVRKIEPNGNG
jgi:hypothetical protein